MVTAQLEQLPSAFTRFDGSSLLIFSESERYSHFLVTEDYAVTEHYGDVCKHNKCLYHIFLHGNNTEDILPLLKDYTFKYQLVDATYAYFKYYMMNDKILDRCGPLTEKLYRAVIYNRTRPHMELRPSILRKRLKRKVCKTHKQIGICKSVATQTYDKSLDKRIESILRSKMALELHQIIDCMIDGHGSVNTSRLYFHIK